MKNLQTTTWRQRTSYFLCVLFSSFLIASSARMVSHLLVFLMFKSAIYLISKSTVFKMCLLGVNILRQCFTVTGCWCWGGGGMGGRLPEEVSLMLACEIHNHWSHCWALISPAVSSLKGQKSIRLHYRADSVVISTQASSPVQAHMRPRPHNTKTESDSWLSFRLRGLMFVFYY